MRLIRTVLTISLLLGYLPSWASAKNLEELLVEKGILSSQEAAELREAASSEKPRLRWDNGLKFEDPENSFSASLYVRYKGSYAYTRNDSDAGRDDVSSFSTNDLWFGTAGGFLQQEFKYKLEANVAGTSSERLRDAYIEWVGNPLTEIRFGHFKTPISKQFNVSSFKLQFNQTSVVSDLVHFDRQNGIGWRTNLAEKRLLVGASMTNGSSSGEGRVVPGNDTKHAGFVFSRLNILGKINDQEEGDYFYSTEPAVSFGTAYGHSSAEIDDEVSATSESVLSNAVTADANFKYK
jgi:phosphate-selective porin